jgi:hypothetical protein
MNRNMQRLHVNNVTTMVYDWVKDWRGPKENKKYDRILLDVPCTNTGVMRRRIDVRWRLKPEDITAQAAAQLELLLSTVQSLASGGVLVYSTCSIDKEENEGVIAKAMEAIPGLKLVETRQTLPHRDGVDGAFAAALRLDRELPPPRAPKVSVSKPAPEIPEGEDAESFDDEADEDFDDELDDEGEDEAAALTPPAAPEIVAAPANESSVQPEDEVVFLAEDEEGEVKH